MVDRWKFAKPVFIGQPLKLCCNSVCAVQVSVLSSGGTVVPFAFHFNI
jgi:hypothetical protein